MKKLFSLLFIIVLLSSCTNNETQEEPQLIGVWKLVEQLVDPGDGSGTFKKIESNKTIEFLANGTVVSNGSLCDMNINSEYETIGEYFTSENYLMPNNENECNFPDLKISFEFQNSNLILWFPCIEGCGQKFKKIE